MTTKFPSNFEGLIRKQFVKNAKAKLVFTFFSLLNYQSNEPD
ncbi:MAG TPA: hypothetical protein VK870_11865 [Ignavibacteriaceae bacterium]|nr:hypothetical protein [Ignavibacteriaceae bacterium]